MSPTWLVPPHDALLIVVYGELAAGVEHKLNIMAAIFGMHEFALIIRRAGPTRDHLALHPLAVMAHSLRQHAHNSPALAVAEPPRAEGSVRIAFTLANYICGNG